MPKELWEMTLEELWELFPIILTEHNPAWHIWYEEERRNLTTILPESEQTRISHIGSTAIDTIWAKPIVDILAEMPKDTDMQAVCASLTDAGWICMSREAGRMSFNKGYTKYGFAERVFHLHLRYQGDCDELYFRDYLNDHPDTAADYERLKLSLWKKYEHDRDGYTAAKTAFVAQVMNQAKAAYPGRYDIKRRQRLNIT